MRWQRLASEAVHDHCAFQKPQELAELAAVIRASPPGRLLEIGTWNGGTTWFLCQLAKPDALVVTVDTDHGRFAGFEPPARRRLELVTADSRLSATRARIMELLDGPLDLLLIDGDHARESVHADWTLYRSLVREGGLIVLHDVIARHQDPLVQVRPLWQTIRRTERTTLEIISASQERWGGLGVVRA